MSASLYGVSTGKPSAKLKHSLRQMAKCNQTCAEMNSHLTSRSNSATMKPSLTQDSYNGWGGPGSFHKSCPPLLTFSMKPLLTVTLCLSLSLCVSLPLSLCLSHYLHLSPYFCLCPSVRPSVRLSACLPVSLPACLPVCLSVCLSLSLFLSMSSSPDPSLSK